LFKGTDEDQKLFLALYVHKYGLVVLLVKNFKSRKNAKTFPLKPFVACDLNISKGTSSEK